MNASDRMARSCFGCRSRSKVVSRLIDLGSDQVTTGRSSMPWAASCIQVPVERPKLATKSSGGAAASSPTVTMPSPPSFSFALGPMPLIFFAGSGQIRSFNLSIDRIVSPLGFSKSEQILERSLFGLMPIEQLKPVTSTTRAFIRWAIVSVSSSRSLRSI